MDDIAKTISETRAALEEAVGNLAEIQEYLDQETVTMITAWLEGCLDALQGLEMQLQEE